MYKVFFVDDEAAMRAGLRDSISWDRSDFVLAGEAPDGELALSLIAEILPDILITDVRMPFMDGIELSRRVARAMPWVKIIILSGHDEFEYAKQAIKIGVSEYLLKPVTSEILFQALEAAAAKIEAERERHRTMEHLKKAAIDAQKLRVEKILSNLVYGMTENLEDEAKELGGFAGLAYYQVVLVRVLPREPDDGRTFARACASISQILAPKESIVSFPEGAERFVCILGADDEAALEEESYATAQAVKYECERSNPCSVSVAIGSSVNGILELPRSMFEARRTLRYISEKGCSLILGFRDLFFPDPESAEPEDRQKAADIGWRSSRHDSIIERARDFISSHYAEQAVSLNTVAELVGLSPNHFSTVFSQETGETFIECLTRTRLDKARELLRSTAARASEIAYLVGYNDPHYFSYVFKKNVGLSPSEFRK